MGTQDKEQSQAFIDKARELEADESGRKFERAFKKIVPRKQRKRNEKANRMSQEAEG